MAPVGFRTTGIGPMTFLIDGYNLLFTLGLAGRRTEPKLFEKARTHLLDWIHAAHGGNVGSVTVVFDGVLAPGGSNSIQNDRGLRVRYTEGELADDVIMDLIRAERHPERLTVVSSDHRIQVPAKRRGCVVWDSTDYVDWVMDKGHAPPKPPRPPPKPDAVTDEEKALWMKEFGSIDDDPEVKKFNRPYKHFFDDT